MAAPVTTSPVEQRYARFTSGPALVLYLAAAKLLFHLLTANRYGIFRDELYYIACSEHLDWGYVDQPPLIALITWAARRMFGDSLLGLRLLPALAGAVLIWLTGKLTREMGGGRFAQVLAALAAFIAPIYLLMHHWMTMNAFEPLIWMGGAWCVLRAIKTEKPHYWLWFGVLAGLGMQTKYSIAFFVFGIFVGLLATSHRQYLRTRWLWIGAALAFLIFLPNLIWLIRHDFPFLELMRNIRMSGRDVVRSPLGFIADQAMLLNPILFPLWIGGLLWLLFGREGRRYRVLGVAYLVMLVSFIALKGKNYYLAAAYPMLFAASALALERLTSRRWNWARGAYITVVAVAGAIIAPTVAPILPVETYIRYQKALGFEPPRAENQRTGPLPQYFADEFGWEEMVREVARVYYSLPPSEQAKAVIFANSYGQAGAIDFFGPKLGLPKAISNHQNYWLWGTRGQSADTVIVLGSDGSGDREHFRVVESVGRVEHLYSRRDEHYDVFLCGAPTFNLEEAWPKMKKWN